MVGGIGMALHEETVTDHRFGRFMTHNPADYHVPVHADVPPIEAIFVEERDEEINPPGGEAAREIREGDAEIAVRLLMDQGDADVSKAGGLSANI